MYCIFVYFFNILICMHLYKYTGVYVTQYLWALRWWEPKTEGKSTRNVWHKTAQALCTYFPSGKKCHFILVSDSDSILASSERALASSTESHGASVRQSVKAPSISAQAQTACSCCSVYAHVDRTLSCCNGIHWNWRRRLTPVDERSCLCTHTLICVQHTC